MIELLDGPAAGQKLTVRRAPAYMRIVRGDGLFDALDQLDDEPEPSEEIFVYKREPGTWGQVFVRPGGQYQMGCYRHLEAVDGESVRDTEAWRAWASQQELVPA